MRFEHADTKSNALALCNADFEIVLQIFYTSTKPRFTCAARAAGQLMRKGLTGLDSTQDIQLCVSASSFPGGWPRICASRSVALFTSCTCLVLRLIFFSGSENRMLVRPFATETITRARIAFSCRCPRPPDTSFSFRVELASHRR